MKTQLPVIETKNLILRKIEESDASDMYEYAKLDYVGPMAGWEPHDSINHTKLVIKNFNRKPQFGGLGVFAITLKATGKMIGTIELHTYVEEFKAELIWESGEDEYLTSEGKFTAPILDLENDLFVTIILNGKRKMKNLKILLNDFAANLLRKILDF